MNFRSLRNIAVASMAIVVVLPPPLCWGDEVKPVPRRHAFVMITSPEVSPRWLQWTPGLTLMAAVAAVGGYSFRAPGEVIIVRGGKNMRVHPDAVSRGREPDLKLEPGDRIELPAKPK